MAVLKIKTVQHLCLDDVGKLYQNSKKLNLREAEVGFQPPETYIVGRVLKVGTNTESTVLHENKKQLIFEEVLHDGSFGLQFEVYFYGELFIKLKKYSKQFDTFWFLFEKSNIVKYTGRNKDFLSLRLRIGEPDNSSCLTLIKSKSNNTGMKNLLTYRKLSEVEPNVRQDVFAVIKEVAKPTVTLLNGNKHTVLIIVDPSCLESNAPKVDRLLHIFFNDRIDCFPIHLEVGDVLRIRGMLGDHFKSKSTIHGKVFNSKALTIFKRDEANHTIFHSNSDYFFTDQDRKIEKSLHEWWQEAGKEFSEKVILNQEEHNAVRLNSVGELEASELNNVDDLPSTTNADPILKLKTIEEVEKETKFSIYCQVVDIHQISGISALLLRVADGTLTKVFTTQFDFDAATQQFCSQTDDIVIGRSTVDILISNIENGIPILEKGDYVELKNVIAELQSNACQPYYEFRMVADNSRFNILRNQDKPSRDIKRKLEELNNIDTECAQVDDFAVIAEGTQQNGVRRLEELSSSDTECTQVDDFEVMAEETPQNGVSDLDDKHANESCIVPETQTESEISSTDKYVMNFSTPTRTESKYENEIPDANLSVISNGLSERDDKENLHLSPKRINEGCKRSSATSPETTKRSKVGASSSSSVAAQNNKTEKPLLAKINRPIKSPICLCSVSPSIRRQPVYTHCFKAPQCPIFSFKEEFNHSDTIRCRVIIKEACVYATTLCQLCGTDLCLHDWVWGLCENCGSTYSSQSLRDLYTKDQLLSLRTLPCSCDETSEGSSIVPFYRLKLLLGDVNEEEDKLSVHLSGDGANLFFGSDASFSWLVSPAQRDIYQKALIVKHFTGPIELGLKKYRHETEDQFFVTGTKLFYC